MVQPNRLLGLMALPSPNLELSLKTVQTPENDERLGVVRASRRDLIVPLSVSLDPLCTRR